MVTFLSLLISKLILHRYDPIQKYGPQDCVASINAIVDKIDALVLAKNAKAIQELKTIFGLGDLEDIRDFAATIAFPSLSPFLILFSLNLHSSLRLLYNLHVTYSGYQSEAQCSILLIPGKS